MSEMILDCCKLDCPQPVMRVKKLLAASAPESFVVLVDNEPAVENVSRFLHSRGYAYSNGKRGNIWRVAARAASGGEAPERLAEIPAPDAGDTADNAVTLLMLSAPVIGRGDDELGAKLLKNFLATAPEFGESLWRIVLVNGGVTLATEDSPVINELRELEKAGVGILVCGACLQYFNLVEKKAVGQTTNMLDIVNCMRHAGKVIRF